MSQTKTNVLLIVTDEQRLTELGAYGTTPCMTPNLDKLARQSIMYDTAYTSCPLCSPARATLLTGCFPHNHGITCNTADIGCNVPELNDSPILLPRILGENGYSCGFNGKWHLGTSTGNRFGNGRKPAVPSDFGFEGMDFPGHGGIGMNYPQYQQYLAENGYTVNVQKQEIMPLLPCGHWPEGEEVGVPYFITDYTISLLDEFRKREKPFYMQHNFWGPHHPYFVPEKYLRMYDDVEIPMWDNFEWKPQNKDGPHKLRWMPGPDRTNWKAWEALIKYKYAFMTYIDHQVGRLLDYLDDSGLAENTVVIFTADHGDNLGGHGGLIDKGFVHFEDTHRIPLLIRDPRNKPAVKHEFASLVDIYPTILDLAGIPCPQGIDGYSLVDKTISPRDYIVTEFHGLLNIPFSMRTIRSGNIKYGWSCCGGDELYNLAEDPFETNNLIDDPGYFDIRREMRLKLKIWMQEHNDKLLRQYVRYL